jgi:hypothetical protein
MGLLRSDNDDLTLYQGDSSSVTKVVGFSWDDYHWSLIVIDKQLLQIEVIHTGRSPDEPRFLNHAICLLKIMGWGDRSQMIVCRTNRKRKSSEERKFFYRHKFVKEGKGMQSCGPVACTYMLQLLSGGELANPELSREIILHHLVQMIQKIGINDKIEYGKIESEEQHKQLQYADFKG